MKKNLFSVICSLVLMTLLVLSGTVIVSAADATPVKTAAEFEAMVSGGSYYLANDIDLGGKEYKDYIFQEFSGTIDGRGHSVLNFSIVNTGENDIGMIQRANKTGDLVIKDLTIGKEGALIKLYTTASGKSNGVIAGANENANTCTLTNVTVYGDLNAATSGKVNAGGFIGYSRVITLTGCKMYGKVNTGTGVDAVNSVYQNAAGFIASINSDITFFENCENHADITCSCSTVEARAAGFVTYTGKMMSFKNCVNYGSCTVYDTAAVKADSRAAGIICDINGEGVELVDCVNAGKISAGKYCGGLVAHINKASTTMDGCSNYGEYNTKADFPGALIAAAEPGMECSPTKSTDNTGKVYAPAGSTVTTAPAATTATTAAATTTTTKATAAATTTTKAAVTTTTAKATTATTKAPATTPTTADSSLVLCLIMIAAIAGTALVVTKKKSNI